MRLRAKAAALAAVVGLVLPGSSYATDAPRVRPPTGYFAVDDIDGIATAMHRHYLHSAALLASEGHGTIVVPSYAEVRATVVAGLTGSGGLAQQAARSAPLDPLNEDDDELETFDFSATDVGGTCVSTMHGEGSKIPFVPLYRWVLIEGAHNCYGARIIVCLTTAVVPSNQPALAGVGIGDSSGGCFARTNKSGFTTKPTFIVGVNWFLVSANEGYGVGLVPFVYRQG